jgi:hypothetical protein
MSREQQAESSCGERGRYRVLFNSTLPASPESRLARPVHSETTIGGTLCVPRENARL